MIEIKNLSKVYASRGRSVTALDGVDLSVAPGTVHGVVGRSGAGKSTLIRCVNLLERPTSGSVWVAGKELTALSAKQLRAERRRIGMVFQHFNLLSSRTARENVELPLEIGPGGGRLTRRERRSRALELLDVVGLADRADAHPAQLSGGQKQRVGIARALAADPHVLLSDEATSALDPETTRSVLRLLKEVNERLGVTVLLITHEMEVVKAVCDSAALMTDGRIAESGTIAELLTREHSELARELFQLGEAPTRTTLPDTTVLDVTFHGDDTAQPLISQLSRTYAIDVTILGAAIETVNGQTVGRMRIGLPGRFEDNVVQIGFLRERGLNVETVGVEGSAGVRGGAEAGALTSGGAFDSVLNSVSRTGTGSEPGSDSVLNSGSGSDSGSDSGSNSGSGSDSGSDSGSNSGSGSDSGFSSGSDSGPGSGSGSDSVSNSGLEEVAS